MRGLPWGSGLGTWFPTSQGNSVGLGSQPPALNEFPGRIQGVGLATSLSWGDEASLPVSCHICFLPGYPVAFADKV